MPRKARLDVPGTLHHVMVREIEGNDIFRDDEDRRPETGAFMQKVLNYYRTKGAFLVADWQDRGVLIEIRVIL